MSATGELYDSPREAPLAEPLPQRLGRSRSNRWRLISVLLITAIATVLVERHVTDVNGPWYWKWPWRHLPTLPLFGWMAAAMLPFITAQWAYERRRVAMGLILVGVATFALQIAAISQQRMGVGRLGELVGNSVNTSYYSAAKVLVEQQDQGVHLSDWLTVFPDLLQFMQVHARYKPPGLVLYYVAIIRVFGDGNAGRMIGGLLIGAAAAAVGPATYWLIHRLGQSASAAWYGASFMALCPSLILFLPQFDQVYPLLTCGMILLWYETLESKRIGLAVAFGTVLALGLFMSYIVLVTGFFLAAYTLIYLGRRGRNGFEFVGKAAVIAVTITVALYVLLWLCTGFDPIATYRAADVLQTKYLIPLQRPFPGHILWDLLDFAMGSGWISYALVAFCIGRVAHQWLRSRTHWLAAPARITVALSLLQIGVVAGGAFLPGEDARLWLLLYPLLMVPIGFELAEWPRRHRWAVYAALWLMLCVIGQNMTFLNMGEGHN